MCLYRDISGNEIDRAQCTIFNVFCKPKCLCNEGYSGSACTLDPSKKSQRDSDRFLLCDAIVAINDVANPSPQLLENLAGSLLSSFNPDEVFSDTTTQRCQEALDTIARLTAEGYIQGVSMGLSALLIAFLFILLSP